MGQRQTVLSRLQDIRRHRVWYRLVSKAQRWPSWRHSAGFPILLFTTGRVVNLWRWLHHSLSLTHTHTCTRTLTHARTYAWTNTHNTHTHTHARTHARTHAHTHTFTHTHTPSLCHASNHIRVRTTYNYQYEHFTYLQLIKNVRCELVGARRSVYGR